MDINDRAPVLPLHQAIEEEIGMEMETKLEEIKLLLQTAEKLEGFHAMYAGKYHADSQCDKKGFGFSRDNRFRAFEIKTGFDSWSGYYGNSGCSTILHLPDSDSVSKFMIKAMNIHQGLLFQTCAKLMREKAAALSEEARKELTAMQDMLAVAEGKE